MKVSVGIMAHPRREALVMKLALALGHGTSVVWDWNDDEWDTGRRAWEAHDPTADWHLVVQDDAIVCKDLVAGLVKALEHVPAEAAVSLYTGTVRPDRRRVADAAARAEAANAAWIVMPDVKWGVALAVPTAVIPDMLAHGDRRKSSVYDWNLRSYFYDVLGWPVWCTWPSLVDHRHEEPGIVRHQIPPSGPRVAHRFLGEHASALDVDWGAGTVEMAGLEVLQRRRRLAAT
jgi:hypothetical protein